ncbi:carbohydrate ABC transporter permease [Paracoccus sp. SCSIO 75233]|uniref:carbohydrate ABC transporter permease n=1 Tax=Paracoccus sp. SCSIO 75233 TaxID=3017782 RepID=UPI0022F13192|nr:carbohydrate ABC transporter permease [Paracoccus sp. SCSIO 75233]WBU52034.1 carbohydrate ABC transporter permease [Paracoccus sp. SCSIO 75233]
MTRNGRTQIVLFGCLLGMAIVNLTPVAWGFLTSIRQPVDAFAVPPKLIFKPTFEFHKEVWIDRGFWKYLVNTAIISVCAVTLSVSIGSMSAYALSRLRGGYARTILYAMLGMRMFPHILLAIPFFVIAQLVGLIDTYLVMILAVVALNQPFTIWLMRSFFDEVPKELYEAATIDGCTPWQTFRRVALPVVRPGIWVTTLFSLLLAYNEFLLALVLTRNSTKTLPVAIAEYGAEDISYWSLSSAAAIGIMLPILIFMLFMQRHLVRGMSAGAVKG